MTGWGRKQGPDFDHCRLMKFAVHLSQSEPIGLSFLTGQRKALRLSDAPQEPYCGIIVPMLQTKAVTGKVAKSCKVTLLAGISTVATKRPPAWAGLALQPFCDLTKKLHNPQGARQLEKHQLW